MGDTPRVRARIETLLMLPSSNFHTLLSAFIGSFFGALVCLYFVAPLRFCCCCAHPMYHVLRVFFLFLVLPVPKRNSDPGSLSRLSSPLPTTVRAP